MNQYPLPDEISNGGMVLQHGERGNLVLRDPVTAQQLLILPDLKLLMPVLNGRLIQTDFAGVRHEPDTMIFCFSSPSVLDLEVRVRSDESYCDFSCRFTVREDTQLNRLELFPGDTVLNLYDVVNFRNRHLTPATWPELNLGQSFQTGTYSDDWQFAPHPSLFVFRKGGVHLLTALADLPQGAFGMHLAVEKHHVTHWYLDYGAQPNGLALKAGRRFASPRLRIMLRHNQSVYDTLDAFSATLVREGQIPDPRQKQRAAWWDEPLYCTWIDQAFKAQAAPAESLRLQSLHPDVRPAQALTEGFVRQAAAVIHRERLPIRTLLIDDGWQIARGQWQPHPLRFPNLRKLVDDLHAQEFKVILWLAWPEVSDDADVPAEFLCNGGQWRTRHGQRFVDFSLPLTQEQYVKPLMHKLFSSDDGCYDLDGFKTDFQADKVHPETPLADRQWRGEENYLFRVTRLLYEQLKHHKPDGMHLGCAGHFWISSHIDLNRTYDVHSSDWREHEQRALMLRHTAPGCALSYDFHNFLENMEEWFASARRMNAAIEIGNLLYVKQDAFSSPRAADADYYRRLRAGLLDFSRNMVPVS